METEPDNREAVKALFEAALEEVQFWRGLSLQEKALEVYRAGEDDSANPAIHF